MFLLTLQLASPQKTSTVLFFRLRQNFVACLTFHHSSESREEKKSRIKEETSYLQIQPVICTAKSVLSTPSLSPLFP